MTVYLRKRISNRELKTRTKINKNSISDTIYKIRRFLDKEKPLQRMSGPETKKLDSLKLANILQLYLKFYFINYNYKHNIHFSWLHSLIIQLFFKFINLFSMIEKNLSSIISSLLVTILYLN